MMNPLNYLAVGLFCAAFFVPAAVRAGEVTNVTATQRAGTKLVDITYDLSSTFNSTVTLKVDNGGEAAVPASAVTGDVGTAVAAGSGKKITWDGGADADGQHGSMTFFLIAEPEFIPLPTESFALIPGRAYRMGKHEVSWSLWQEVRSWAVDNGYDLYGVGLGKGDQHPVHSVNWYDVVKWCNAASERAGLEPVYYVTQAGAVYRSGQREPYIDTSKQGYRLPSEEEWEYAARGGLIGKTYPWGDVIHHNYANYYYYFGNGYHADYFVGLSPYTSPVGSFDANGYDLYDMAGNVSEWCDDLYDASSRRVQRGGGWYDDSVYCRVAYRPAAFGVYPDNRINSNHGFRLALSE